MWRPGKLGSSSAWRTRFLSTEREPPKTRPLAGPRRSPDSQLRSGYALPSSRIRRHFLILVDGLCSPCLSRSSHRAQIENPHLASQQQHLHEQPLDLRQKPPPERRDRVVVRVVIRRDEAKCHRIVCRTLQLAAPS